MSDFTFIDLFAGIGGMRLGLEAAGGECVFTSEWDKFAQATYKANFGDEQIAGDITKIEAADIPAHDVLAGGMPCQAFSLAGVSKNNSLGRAHGFADTRGTLFFDMARIASHHRPRAIIIENVANLLAHDKGRTFKTIKRVLEDMGYHVQHRIFDARSWVPQKRRRIFIVATREEPTFDLNAIKVPDPELGPRLKSILHPQDGSEDPDPQYLDPSGKVLDKFTLSDRLWQYLQDYAAKHQKAGNGFGYGLVGPDDIARTISARYHKDGSEILIDQGRYKNPRKLTPREAMRLQGFDTPERRWQIPVSNTQAWKQAGNALVPMIPETIGHELVKHLQRTA